MTGLSGARAFIIDATKVAGDPSRTQLCIQMRATRGELGKPIRCRTEQEIINAFGPPEDTDTDRFYVNRIVNSGFFDVIISPTAHYGDIDDITSAVGTKATGTKTVVAVAETRATGTIVFSGGGDGTGAGTVQLSIYRVGQPAFNFPVVEIPANATPTSIAAAVAATYNGLFGFGFAASTGTVTITAPVGVGASANDWKADVTKTGFSNVAVNVVITDLGGVTAGANGVVGGQLDTEAKSVGTGYNGCTLVIVPAVSGKPGLVDLVEYIPGNVEVNRITDLATTLTQEQFDDINSATVLQNIDSPTFKLLVGTIALSGGAKDNTTIVAADLIGSEIGGTGWYSFGNVSKIDYMANLNFAERSVDLALQAYTKSRGDFGFYFRTPISASPQGMLDYRYGQGSFSGLPFDSYLGTCVGGTYRITDTKTNQTRTVSPIHWALIKRAHTDKVAGKWVADAGYGKGDNPQFGFGQIEDTEFKDVPVNLISPSYKAIAAEIKKAGITLAVDHPDFGFTIWENRTVLQNDESMLKFRNVANCCIHFVKVLLPCFEKRTFKGADPSVFRQIYRDAKIEIDKVEAGQAGYVGGIEPGWKWLGDQDVDNISQCVENKPADLNNGKYKARFVFTPKAGMEELTLYVTAMDSQTFLFTFGK